MNKKIIVQHERTHEEIQMIEDRQRREITEKKIGIIADKWKEKC